MARLINETAMELVGILAKDCKNPGDLTSMLKELFSGTLEKMLEAELDEHLGYEKNSIEGNNSGNSRNGYGKKNHKKRVGRK